MTNFLKFKLTDATPLQHGAEGYGRSVNKMARDGIYVYLGRELRDDLIPDQPYNVLRRASEVGSPESLASYAGKPMTVGHPFESVDVTNWEFYAVGHIGDDAKIVVEDGVSYVEATNQISSGRGATAILAGDQEISMGYDCLMDFTGGVFTDADGNQIPYIAEQLEIRINHAAIVPAGRAGNAVRIITDEAGVERYCFGAVDKILPDDGGESPPITDSGQPKSKPLVNKKEKLMTDKNPTRKMKIGDADFELEASVADRVQDAISVIEAGHKTALADLATAHETALGLKDAELSKANETIADLAGKALTPEALNDAIAERTSVIARAKLNGMDVKDGESLSTRDYMVAACQTKDGVGTTWNADTALDTIKQVFDALCTAKADPLAGQKLGDGKAVMDSSAKSVIDSAKQAAKDLRGGSRNQNGGSANG